MGAFLLVHKRNFSDEKFNTAFPGAKAVFAEKIKLNSSIEYDLGDYCLYLFKKRFYESTNFLILHNGDFIAVTGSLFYKGSSGENALNSLYNDYIDGLKIENHCKGHYCVILKNRNEIICFRDYFGLYPVYHNSDYSIISSSFLVTAMLLRQLTVMKDELFEYLLNGYWYGNQTLFGEIKLLPERGFIIIDSREKKSFDPDHLSINNNSHEELVTNISSDLVNHFLLLTNSYPKVRMGLSGGYDSRLILASLLNLDEKPNLYVNGTPNSTDIKCARNIAEGLDLPIEEIHFYEEYKYASTRTEEFFMNRFYHFDGLGTSGIFDNYSDLEYSLKHPFEDVALLNGAGGEIYREAWNLPNRKLALGTFVKARYDKPELRIIMREYSREEYFENIINKLETALGTQHSTISRKQVELLHIGRYKALHFILSTHQQLCPFILPFYEPDLIYQSLEIPVKLKYNAKINKALINNIYPEIASYISAYGYTFNEAVPARYIVNDYIHTNIPLKLRPILRLIKKSRKLPVTEFGVDLLHRNIVSRVLPQSNRYMDKYIHIDKISNKGILSRSLTVEFLLQQLQVYK